ncbi:hypothetical protein M427DRAFT_249480 [Gonapodya prolifera JEL478]|uniref:Uncharacterized protein n=1 Tax=Gonapodya prolifera (strain JEL478) TaxID=1344416 RepID=A0A138ZXL5_GONPJ|nr:hypothetical protein M427DRAFT_249480 [Gonapodya prolifera JEL478]|eukprot:KXS09191.1 hypothetical protein M427DRAFT_249480 [Gonapodya prolifera JEL478]
MPLFQAINERFVQPGGEVQLNLSFAIVAAAAAVVRKGECTVGVFDGDLRDVLRCVGDRLTDKQRCVSKSSRSCRRTRTPSSRGRWR